MSRPSRAGRNRCPDVHVNGGIDAITAESCAPGEAGPVVADALRRLGSWLRADLDVSGDVPGAWAGAFR